ncbi:GDP-mannose 4,6-dehydratase [Francisella philomiragia]|uniref:GDP-mannose 4,6-dehydratase n=1 Tax=Francisella philomiragia TaxID=28110 RepID=A0AAW3D963_9GAMM|nr:GDP-mannose 4,6-dehydratase [Francisella philomiragia]KFJ42254.1 rmlD substrate binding domain protein [Francisella philomiragia]MBK2255596.1 GDP-mannose 4,6-dehydratase [Francisella philomiragia]MBK2273912.1 GDP-mannose 4,6-dehydratase [Francisella philomiragia]MBK2277751.1 GDP-mannose 4,6-dehydratase [Francisella philomiragia]MBK2281669.1 GDP-mannose 4,6-dehydratase [Francisella philomiragia]
MKTAIITGITGQDGSYLAKLLINKGYRVIGTVRSYRNVNMTGLDYLGIAKDVIIEELDLLDVINIISLLKKYQPNEIYNLAAQSSVGLSYNQPIGTFTFNTASVNNLLESIRLFDMGIKLYQASSSEMYGNVTNPPIRIDTPMSPISPYGVSKMAAHYMVSTYRESYGIYACNGILFNHESYLRSNNFFVKKIIRSAIAIKKGKLDVLKVGNLDVKRDFGYAPLYVEVMWKMLQQENPDDFIICSGKSVLLRDIVEYVFDKLGVDKNLIVVDDNFFRPNEIADIYGDNSKAKSLLGWDYDYTFFDILNILIEEELLNNIH